MCLFLYLQKAKGSKYFLIPIELIVQKLKHLVDDDCHGQRKFIHADIELLSKALFLSDLPDDIMNSYK